MEAGDAEHGVMDAVALQAAVAEDLPALHVGEGVLDAGADLPVGRVGLRFPGRQFGLALFPAVRDDQAGASVAPIRDDCGPTDCSFGSRQLPSFAVVPVTGQRAPDGDDEPGVGVDDDLVIGGVPVVFDCSAMVWSRVGTSVPSTIRTVSLRNRLRAWSANVGPRLSMMRSAADFETPNSGASCHKVRFVRQYVTTRRTRSSNGRLHGRPLRTTSAPSRRSAVISFPNCCGLSPVNGAIQERSDTVITPDTARFFHAPQCWPMGSQEGCRCGSTTLSRHSRSSALIGRVSSSNNALSAEACAAKAALTLSRSG